MLLFWIAAAGLSMAAAAMIFTGAARAMRTAGDADPAQALYRRQMTELDELVERGVLDETEHRTARAEAGRRLLAASERGGAEAAAAPSPQVRKVAIAAAIAVPLAAAGLYAAVGAPGMADQPFSLRLAQWKASDVTQLDPAQRAALLKDVLRDRPNDVEGLRFLARDQIASNDPFQAEINIRHALTLAPQRADLWALLGEALMAAGDGALSKDAVAAFETALQLDPKSLPARYFVGRARIEGRQSAEGLVLWRSIAAEFPIGSTERAAIETEIADVERTGAIAAPNALAGEDPQMQQAIRGMVAGLAARLKANPEDPEGWVRLVRAYTVLGQTAERDAALAEARRRYADRRDIMQALEEALKTP